MHFPDVFSLYGKDLNYNNNKKKQKLTIYYLVPFSHPPSKVGNPTVSINLSASLNHFSSCPCFSTIFIILLFWFRKIFSFLFMIVTASFGSFFAFTSSSSSSSSSSSISKIELNSSSLIISDVFFLAAPLGMFLTYKQKITFRFWFMTAKHNKP